MQGRYKGIQSLEHSRQNSALVFLPLLPRMPSPATHGAGSLSLLVKCHLSVRTSLATCVQNCDTHHLACIAVLFSARNSLTYFMLSLFILFSVPASGMQAQWRQDVSSVLLTAVSPLPSIVHGVDTQKHTCWMNEGNTGSISQRWPVSKGFHSIRHRGHRCYKMMN